MTRTDNTDGLLARISPSCPVCLQPFMELSGGVQGCPVHGIREPRFSILESPCTSYWLKKAAKAALKRDPVDALRDAELLVELLKAQIGGE